MANFIRKNAWNQNGSFNNQDLLWYAKGVGVMQSRHLDDVNSWWFFAAIHGEYLTGETTFPGWGFVSGPPSVPTTPMPAQSVQDEYWDQCQHQSWYFPPWHRGYLIALEAQIREAVIALGGPHDWSLPYWNYFGTSNQFKIPPAFTQPNLPDGSANPLLVKMRYGPQNNGIVFVPIPPVSHNCQRNTIYTGSNAATSPPGYGGRTTGFWHGGGNSGNLENNPHNMVHSYVGGQKSNTDYGLMSDPGTAALDPIFYLHHCNIDRMWASWNASNPNPTASNWVKGPAATGGRAFVMPMPGGKAWKYTPGDMSSLHNLNYTYDNLTTGVPLVPPRKNRERLSKLGVESDKTNAVEEIQPSGNPELVGANQGALEIKSDGARTTVRLDPQSFSKVPKSITEAAPSKIPDRVYLQLEDVKGNMDATVLAVAVNNIEAGHVSLFGLRRATKQDGPHGGAGLNFLLDVTDIVDQLHVDQTLNTQSLDVTIHPSSGIPETEKITVGRVSLYREGQQG